MKIEGVKKRLAKLGFDDVDFTGKTGPSPVPGEFLVEYETQYPDAPLVVSKDGDLRLEPWDYPASTFA